MVNFFKGIVSVIYSGIAMLLYGWLIRWGVLGLLSIPEWQTYLILFCIGYFIYGILDLIGGLVMFPFMWLLKENNIFWRCASLLLIIIAVVNNCILFWTVDAPYGFTQILVSALFMILYLLKGGQAMLNCFIKDDL